MKVRPSVKPMCERCRVIKRHGPHHGHLHQPATQAAAGVEEEHWHESQASTFREKRLEVGLTYIFGVGRSTALQICTATGLSPDERVRDLGSRDHDAARVHRRNLQVEGDLRRERQQSIKRLQRSAPTAACATAAASR